MIPGSANTLLLATAAGGGGYEVSRSVRFNSADSAYLSRTPGSAGSGTTWSLSFWVKKTGNDNFLFAAGSASSDRFNSGFNSSDKFFASVIDGNSTVFSITTDAVFRDPSAWYHFLLVADTTNGTQANRFKIYVNGVQQTVSGTLMPSSQNTKLNGAVIHTIGVRSYTAADYFNGYLADAILIDGQALTPTSFGEFDTNGVWQPKAFSGGSYGTNGFRLDFADNSSAAALGYDAAGSNDWTVNNLSVAAGAGNDSLRDSPTNGSQTDTGVGGEVVGNYCTLNPLDNGGLTLSNGNLDANKSTSGNLGCRSSIGVSSGKWYWEFTATTATSGSTSCLLGIQKSSSSLSTYVGADANGWGYFERDGTKVNNGSFVSYGSGYTNGDIIGVAFDADNGTLAFYKNGVSQGTAFSSLTSGPYFPAISLNSFSGVFNFGQRPFAYTAPSGFKALCTANLPAPTITNPSTVMDVKLYTGNSSTQTISGLGFSPDFVWLKQRTNAENHGLFDTVRGAQKSLCSNNTVAENATDTNSLTAFTSDGFSLGNTSRFNDNTYAHVAWTWDAGTSNATNTSGTITSTVRANISAGFSIVTWTGTGANATVGHGLGVAPQLVIIKRRSGANDWIVGHTSLGGWANFLYLNLTNAKDTASTIFQSTAPTSSSFSLGTSTYVNGSSETYVAYCFAPVAGYSAFGSYTGNGSSDGPMIWTGMRPRWVMIKRTDSTSYWHLYDTARNTYNTANTNLWANGSDAEISDSAYNVDITSNGFKLRTSDAARNASGGTYAYVAFAEHPFALARAR